ncbi:MAG: GTP-binding protein [Thermomicrobiales bacterium]
MEAWEETWDSPTGSEADEYGFHSFTYRAERPFRFAPFRALFEAWNDEVLRAKGFVTFSDSDPVVLSVVRDQAEVQVLVGDDDAEDGAEAQPSALEEETGSEPEDGPAVELIFIGRNMPVAEIRRELDACLVTA